MGRPKKVESTPSNLIPVKDAQGNILSYMTAPGVTHTMPVYEPPRKPVIGDTTFSFDTSKGERLDFQLLGIDASQPPSMALYRGSKTVGWGTVGGGRLNTVTEPVLTRLLFAAPEFLKLLRTKA